MWLRLHNSRNYHKVAVSNSRLGRTACGMYVDPAEMKPLDWPTNGGSPWFCGRSGCANWPRPPKPDTPKEG